MKNKILVLLMTLIVLSIYPAWRYFENASIFANAMFDHASGLGKWSHGTSSTKFDGEITIRNVSFKPNNYIQSFEIESIKFSVEPMFLLKTSSNKLRYMLPESLSVSINGASMSANATDINSALRNDSLWMLMAGYGGSFGCQRESYSSFDETTWTSILANDQIFNVDLFYSRQFNGTLDIDLILDAENLFSSTWSSNLKSSYNDKQIVVDELIIDKLYYNFLDNGFNLIRNNACKENYNSSFATYRLSSAEHVQKYFRTYFSKELPEVLINWYQRMLSPDVEYNAIITLDERKYLSDIYRIDQRDLFENSLVEVATTPNEYLPVILQAIDFTNLDPELLKKENLKREQNEKNTSLDKLKQEIDKQKPKIFTTERAGKKRIVALSRINSAINKKIRIKTARGRPITGILRTVNSETLLIESQYKTGKAKLAISLNNIVSVEIVR